jgi:hypothetical protein
MSRKKELKAQGKQEDKEFVDFWKEKMKQLVYYFNIGR